jgi:putative spermidine/putrescine transport system ATP-binding protein
MIRPESIAVQADPAGPATVVTASFLGSTGSLHAVTESGESVLAQIDNDAVATFSPGDKVSLLPRPNPALAVPTDATDTSPAGEATDTADGRRFAADQG